MLRIIGFIAICAFSIGTSVSAQSSGFEGLYYPENSDIEWSCDENFVGNDGGAYKIEDDKLYRVESVCSLKNPKQTAYGLEYLAQCMSEGEPYRDIITLNKRDDGLSIKSEYGTSNWLQCKASNWVSGYQMGTSETFVSNDNNERINFSCGDAQPDYPISIFLPSGNGINGPVALVVDGLAFNFIANDDWIKIDNTCADCLENYGAAMKAIFKGKSLVVVSGSSDPMAFGIAGAKEAFYGEICFGAGLLVKADHVDCKLITNNKLQYQGQCSISKNRDIINVYTVERDLFIPIHLNENTDTATVYWNGPNGGNHAHDNLGEMRRTGQCWKNEKSAICYAQ